jgi:C4-dicarboxylate transporter, DctM subunit
MLSADLIGVVMLILVIFLIMIGVHIGISLLATSILGLWLITGDFVAAAGLMGSGPFAATYDYTYAVIPLFVLMGYFANVSGASRDLYDAGFAWFGRLPGGLGIVTIFSNAVFGAVTGVSIASAAVFSKIAVPEMLRAGYSKRFSTGCVSGSSVLGMIIPPSVMMILYGILADESIGKLFISGIIPGVVLSINYSIGVSLMVYLFPKYVGSPSKVEKMGWGFRFKALGRASSIFVLIVMVLGGIYGGLFTPTEAGALGCVGALAVMILKGNFNYRAIGSLLMEAGATIASVFLIFIGAQMYSRMLSVSGLVVKISNFMLTASVPPSFIILGMLLIYVFLGCFLDVLSIMLITLPIFLPAIRGFGYNIIWFAVLSVMTIETGLMTPPFGMSVFVVKGSLGDIVTLEDVFKGSFPFLLILCFTIVIVFFFPILSTWLPSKM